MVVGCDEAAALYALLGEEQRPLGEVLADFSCCFPSEARFGLCSALAFLFEDKKMLQPSQRLVAFAIIHHTYSSQQSSPNPFISFLIDVSPMETSRSSKSSLNVTDFITVLLYEAACDDAAENFESTFIQLLLGYAVANNNKEVMKQSVAEFIKDFDPSSYVLAPQGQLRKQHIDGVRSEPYTSISRTAAVNNVIADPDVPHGCDATSSEPTSLLHGAKPRIGAGDRDAAVTGLLQNLSLERLAPQWIKSPPPRLPVLEGELLWLNPSNNHELLWDYGMCANTSHGAAVRDLIAKALKGPLAPAQQEEVLAELANDPKLVYHCRLSPIELRELVEHNPLIAVGVLVKLMDSAEIVEYFTVLLNTDVSLHSMEVVNRLTTTIELPKPFIHKYIRHCISSCQSIEDKCVLEKLVRLIYAFLQSLFQREIVNVEDLFDEVQHLSIVFSQFNEAVGLFKHLKTSE